jgi:hypothetical protein
MKKPPRTHRRPRDEPLFTQPSNDPTIVPDGFSPTVEGYFRIPAVWIGDAPDPDTVLILNPPVHHEVVLKKTLRCGIEARVQRDGTFLFDFASWPLAPTIVVPGYRMSDAQPIPQEHGSAEDRAEAYAIIRAQVMNAHQACMTTAERVVKNRSAMMGLPMTVANTHKAIGLDTPHSSYDDIEDIHALARNVLNNKDQVHRPHPLPRRVLELDVVEYSLDLLDSILTPGDVILIQMIEAIYIAACRKRDKRFGEAAILAWGVCEQLISSAWTKLLDDTKASGGPVHRVPKERRKKLTGRDYTASVMVEILEITGRIDHDLYRLLETARKTRNDWAHGLIAPKETETDKCILAAVSLLRQLREIDLLLQSGGRPGVTRWHVWLREQKAQQTVPSPPMNVIVG